MQYKISVSLICEKPASEAFQYSLQKWFLQLQLPLVKMFIFKSLLLSLRRLDMLSSSLSASSSPLA